MRSEDYHLAEIKQIILPYKIIEGDIVTKILISSENMGDDRAEAVSTHPTGIIKTTFEEIKQNKLTPKSEIKTLNFSGYKLPTTMDITE